MKLRGAALLCAGLLHAQTAPQSVITSLTPSSVVAGQGTFPLTVSGLNFCSPTTGVSSQVFFGQTNVPTTFISSSQLSATIDGSLIPGPGTVSVRVVNSRGCNFLSSDPVPFTITPRPAMTLTALDPPSIPAGSPGFTLGVLGSGFASNQVVTWNGAALQTVAISNTILSASVPANLVTSPGTAQIMVRDPASGLTSNALDFPIVLPAIVGFTPTSAAAGGPNFTLTIDGANFLNGAVVTWSRTPLPTSFVNSTRLTATVSASLIALQGQVSIGVTNPGQNVSNSVTFTIAAAAITITTDTLARGVAGSTYSQPLAATGGTAPYTWSIIDGALPAALTLSPGGVISGTPTAAGTSRFTVQVRDSVGATAAKSFVLTVDPAALAITTASPLPSGFVSVPYAATITASGGQTPYAFSGSAPAGLTLASNGTISGTPATAGSFTLTVTVTDAAKAQASKSFDLAIAPALAISTTSLPAGTAGAPYSATIAATGGRPPYAFTGNVPAGLTLDSSGTVSGTPNAAGTFSFTVTVADAANNRASRSFDLTIGAGLSITTASPLARATVGSAYTAVIQASGGRPPYAFTGDGPAGLSLDASGSLSGTPSQPGTFTFTVTVADAAGLRASKQFSITIGLPAAPAVSIGGLSDTVAPGTQPSANVSLGNAFPADITGQMTLTFTPDVTGNITASTDDPAIQFANGRRTFDFTLPAGSTQTPQAGFQTGTVAGAITITVRLAAAGSDITPATPPARTIRINRLAPVITSVRVVRTTNGFDVVTVGYATTREITQSTFRFTPASGANLQTTDVTVQAANAFTTWYQSTASGAFGSQFSYTQPFTVQGNAGAFTSVAVTLANAIGASQATNAPAP